MAQLLIVPFNFWNFNNVYVYLTLIYIFWCYIYISHYYLVTVYWTLETWIRNALILEQTGNRTPCFLTTWRGVVGCPGQRKPRLLLAGVVWCVRDPLCILSVDFESSAANFGVNFNIIFFFYSLVQPLPRRWMVNLRTARWVEWPVSRVCPRCRRASAACWTRAAAPGEKWRGCTWRKPWSRTTWAAGGTTPTTCSPTSRPTSTRRWLSCGKRWWGKAESFWREKGAQPTYGGLSKSRLILRTSRVRAQPNSLRKPGWFKFCVALFGCAHSRRTRTSVFSQTVGILE